MVLCDTDAVILFHCLYHRFVGYVTLWRVYLCATLQNHSPIFIVALLVSPITNWPKFYTEYEPHGKKMHVFIGDYLDLLLDFKAKQKAIYHEDRIELCGRNCL